MEHILQQFNGGSEKAFKVLFEHFFKRSCAFVSRYISGEAVEDVVQETFINIWEKRGVCFDMVYFKAYLYKSLYNNSLFYLRRMKLEEEIDPGMKDETDGIFNAMIAEEVHATIIEAIDKLPQQRKKIIELSMSDFSQDEIAGMLSVSINTVKTQKKKAYAFLRGELKELFILFLFFIGDIK